MNISVSISPVWRRQALSEAGIVEKLRECGFRFLCEEFDAALADGDMKSFARERLRLVEGCGMRFSKARVSASAPYMQRDEIRRVIAVCGEMGISHLVIPLGTSPDNTRREYYTQNREYVNDLLKEARACRVTLLIEHAGNYQNMHHTHCGMELNDFWEFMGEPEDLKVNANIANMGMADICMYPDLRVLGSRIASVDASDNFFAMPLGVMKDRENLGLAPLMGFLDFDEILLALKEIGFNGFFNVRMNSPRLFDKRSPYVKDAKLDVMPLTLLQRHYAWAYKVTAHMLKTYNVLDEAGERQ